MPKIYSIYKITNLVNQKCYIGFTSKQNPHDRYKGHIKDSKDSNNLLHKAMRKYGIENFIFEVIYQSLEAEYTYRTMEQYFIEFYKSFHLTGLGYNMTRGGVGTLDRKHSEDTRKKIGIKSATRRDSEYTKQLKSDYWKVHNPFKDKFGNNNSNSKSYIITFTDGKQKTIVGLQHFAKENGYSRRSLYCVMNGESPSHNDIIKVEKIT